MNSLSNLLPCFYAFLFSLLFIPSPVLSELEISQSSPIDNINNSSLFTFNITKDSSLSIDNGDRYWLSPSGIFAFGFYPIGVQDGIFQYHVGIWNHKSPKKTLVWIANRDDGPFSSPSSIVFSKKGNLVRISDTNTISMVCSVEVEEIATSAMIHDDGNFVLYNSTHHVVWQSFDYPTDTILPGQTFKFGSTLVASKSSSDYSSGRYKLRIDKDGNVNIYNNNDRAVSTIYRSTYIPECAKMKLTSNGRFSLIDRNGFVIKSFNEEGELNGVNLKNGMIMYWVKLDSDGNFCLYSDGIGANIENSCKIGFYNVLYLFVLVLSFLTTLGVLGLIYTIYEDYMKPAAPTSKNQEAMISKYSNLQGELKASDSKSNESMASPHQKTEVSQTLRYRDVSA